MEIDRLTPERKLELVRGMAQADSVAEFARQEGVDRSYLYQLRREADSAMLEMWRERKLGRPSETGPEPEPDTLDKYAAKKIKRLEREVRHWQIPAQAMALMLEALMEAGIVKKTCSPHGCLPSRDSAASSTGSSSALRWPPDGCETDSRGLLEKYCPGLTPAVPGPAALS
jgi:transposase-like protein